MNFIQPYTDNGRIVSRETFKSNFLGGLRISDGSYRIFARFNNRSVVDKVGAIGVILFVVVTEIVGCIYCI
jgi:hypothetical protein